MRSRLSPAFRCKGYSETLRLPVESVEWALELSSFGLKFESTSTIQSRALAEFIAEWTPNLDEEVPEIVNPGKESTQEWIMYFDGAFSLQGSGSGVLLVASTAEHLKYVVQMHFPWEEATNNTSEYEGLLAVLRIATELGSRSSLSGVTHSLSSAK